MILKVGIKWSLFGALIGSIIGVSIGVLQRSVESFLKGLIIGYLVIMGTLTLIHFTLKKLM